MQFGDVSAFGAETIEIMHHFASSFFVIACVRACVFSPPTLSPNPALALIWHVCAGRNRKKKKPELLRFNTKANLMEKILKNVSRY